MAEEEHTTGKKKSASSLFKDKKVLVGLGIFALLGVIFVAVHSANKNASQSGTGQAAGSVADPATGYPYGSYADSQALGGGYFPGGSSGGSSGGSVPPVNITINPPGSSSSSSSTSSSSGGGGTMHHGHNPPPHHHSNSYVVKPGDTLWGISNQFHISGGWHTLYNLNRHTVGSNPNLIHPGQKLTLP